MIRPAKALGSVTAHWGNNTGAQRLTPRMLPWLRFVYASAAVLITAVAMASEIVGIEPSRFTLDPAVLAGFHPLLGMLSGICVVLWAAAASISLFTATLLRTGEQERKAFLLSAGFLTSWLLLDDLFLFHEWLFPTVLGVPQVLVLALYASLVAALALRFRALIVDSEYMHLMLAVAFFAASMGVDQLPLSWFSAWNYLHLVEDGAKLLGIVSWLGYLGHVCTIALEREDPQP